MTYLKIHKWIVPISSIDYFKSNPRDGTVLLITHRKLVETTLEFDGLEKLLNKKETIVDLSEYVNVQNL